MKVIKRRITANTGQNIHAVGRFIWLKSATGQVLVKSDRGETAVLTAGDFVRMDKSFTEFFVTDESGAQNDVTFNISEQGEAGLYTTAVNLQVPGSLIDIADKLLTAATATLVLAANANRNEAIITGDAGNANSTRIGSSAVAANRGTPLAPGQTIILDTTAAIYAFNAAAEYLNVGYTEF